MLTEYELKMPHAVYAGENALQKIEMILKANKVSRVVIFTDKGIEGNGLLELPLKWIRSAGAEAVVLDDLPNEPSYLEAQAVIDQCKQYDFQMIVGIGGGSVMDTAKLASMLMTDEYGVKELLDNPLLAKKQIKTLMIPTTAGTGSEATPNAIVAVPEKELKVGIVNAEMISDYVILDAEMIKNMPAKVAAATGVDALSHAIECWTSNKANPLSDTFSMRALDMILNNIEEACTNPDAMEAKNTMQVASFFAGVAITASGTTGVHALSYPLGGKYHIAHGVSNAILLVPVMRFNEPAIQDRLAEAYDRCVHTEHTCTTDEEKSGYMIEWLARIVRNLKIPTNLREFNVPVEDLDGLVDAGMQVTRLLVNNIRKITPEDARAIYRQVLN